MLIDLLATGPQESLAFTVQLSESGEAGRIRMPVAITGSWVHPANQRKIVVTGSDLRTAIQNFRKKSSGEINVDYDHASEMPNLVGQPRPSAGRVLDLCGPEAYTDPRGTRREILWGEYEPTEMARGMIRKREYRYISPVLARARVDKSTGEAPGMTITTIALTNTPVLEEMPQIFCSQQGEVLTRADTYLPNTEGGNVSNDDVKGVIELIFQRAIDKRIPLEQALRDMAKEKLQGAYDDFTRRLTKDDPNSQGAQIAARRGRASGGASDELAEMTRARAEADGISYELALRAVGRENPGLVERARQAVIGKIATPKIVYGTKLSALADERADAKGIPFAEALSEVSRENRELTRLAHEEVY